jgi:hypothetical protein
MEYIPWFDNIILFLICTYDPSMYSLPMTDCSGFRPLATITYNSLAWYGRDDDGAGKSMHIS